MILTKEVLLDFLIKMYREKNWHEDFNNLNQKKFIMIKNKLGLSDDMIILEKGNFIFKERPDKNLGLILKIEEPNERIVSMINYHFNLLLKKYILIETNIFDGAMTTCIEEQAILKEINFSLKNYAFNSHKKQMLEELKSLLLNLLNLLYNYPFKQYRNLTDEELEKSFKVMFNTELNDEEKKLFYSQLDEIEYM